MSDDWFIKPGEPPMRPGEVRKISTWITVTNEMLADALPLNARIEYLLSDPPALSFRERLTGWRRFRARSGFVLVMRVGWRERLHEITHPIETWRRKHAKPEDDDCD